MKFTAFQLACLAFLGLGGAPLLAEVKLPAGFVREAVAAPDVREPMDLAFAPDRSAWITARGGQIWRVDLGTPSRHLGGTIATDTKGDRGLHGLAFHPDFPTDNRLYLFSHAVERPV